MPLPSRVNHGLTYSVSLTVAGSFLLPEVASAYAGLGALVPAIGNGIMLLFIACMTLFGLIAYPLKALWDSRHRKQTPPDVQRRA